MPTAPDPANGIESLPKCGRWKPLPAPARALKLSTSGTQRGDFPISLARPDSPGAKTIGLFRMKRTSKEVLCADLMTARPKHNCHSSLLCEQQCRFRRRVDQMNSPLRPPGNHSKPPKWKPLLVVIIHLTLGFLQLHPARRPIHGGAPLDIQIIPKNAVTFDNFRRRNIREYQEALRLKPDFADASNSLYSAMKMKNTPAALDSRAMQ